MKELKTLHEFRNKGQESVTVSLNVSGKCYRIVCNNDEQYKQAWELFSLSPDEIYNFIKPKLRKDERYLITNIY